MSYTCLLSHIIFSTKDRVPLLTDDIKPRVHSYLAGIVKNIGGKPIRIGGADDHVHVFAELPPTVAPADVLRVLKSNSSGWIHKQFGAPFHWQTKYAALSVSRSGVPDLSAYIERQEEHHKRVSFQDELRSFLREQGMVIDERYLWL